MKPEYRPHILLTRDDLNRESRNKAIGEIQIYDFRHSSITLEDYNRADSVIFSETKTLKNINQKTNHHGKN